ncbi:MAG: hypothetical protein DRJ64_00955 [Thermoprotei archaeon]|nr:MAG: hypothetical protein DRJ64_00955 [Thermoprotei archaeon]
MRKTLFAVLAIGILAYFPVAYAINIWPFNTGGIEFRIHFHDHKGNVYDIPNTLPWRSSNFVIYYQVFINSYDNGLTEIAKGKTSESRIVIRLNEKLEEICEEWLNRPYSEDILIGVELDLCVIDKDTNEIVGRFIEFRLVDPMNILQGGLEIEDIDITILERHSLAEFSKNVPLNVEPSQVGYCDWMLEYKLTPEDIAEVLEEQGLSDWVMWVDDKAYIKTPVLVVENTKNSLGISSEIDVSFYIEIEEETTLEGSLAIGSGILQELSRGKSLYDIAPEITLYKGVKTISRKVSYGGNTAEAFPGNTVYFYLWTRPYFEYYKWYVEGIPTSDEKFIAYVSDFLMEDEVHISVGSSTESIPETLLRMMYESTEQKYYGSLDVGDVLFAKDIANNAYDTEKAGSVDFGSLVCVLTSFALSYLNPPLGIIASAITVSISYSYEVDFRVLFHIRNCGDGTIDNGPPEPGCYNAKATVYYEVTLLKYRKDPLWPWESPYYFSIPTTCIILEYPQT